ncbi:MAG: GWxTD domain-containing protein [Candidatus Cloacimonetes bacterium]|nr:GWxTD domain-containing protein [Candidatus Cloacimonadota bacterium]
MKKKYLIMACCFIFIFIGKNTNLFPEDIPDEVSEMNNEQRVFDDIDDEYKLINYFLNSKQKKYCRSLEDIDKRKFIEEFWKANDPNPITEKNEFLEEIKFRIEYCNRYFTHFNPGWKTDRGRIYIKYGKPYEILKEITGVSAKYPQKDYHIWKYRITNYLTFIFIDIQQHGNFRLIFSDGDDAEGSWADWLNYLGSDFDEGKLY